MQKECNRPEVLEGRSKCIHLDKVKLAQEGRREPCRLKRQPLEVPNQYHASGHLRAHRLSSPLQRRPVGEHGFPDAGGDEDRSMGRERRGGIGRSRRREVREASLFHFSQKSLLSTMIRLNCPDSLYFLAGRLPASIKSQCWMEGMFSPREGDFSVTFLPPLFPF